MEEIGSVRYGWGGGGGGGNVDGPKKNVLESDKIA